MAGILDNYKDKPSSINEGWTIENFYCPQDVLDFLNVQIASIENMNKRSKRSLDSSQSDYDKAYNKTNYEKTEKMIKILKKAYTDIEGLV